MNAVALAVLLVFSIAALAFLIFAPFHPSMADEERELREYFKRRDAAEKRGELYPPR